MRIVSPILTRLPNFSRQVCERIVESATKGSILAVAIFQIAQGAASLLNFHNLRTTLCFSCTKLQEEVKAVEALPKWYGYLTITSGLAAIVSGLAQIGFISIGVFATAFNVLSLFLFAGAKCVTLYHSSALLLSINKNFENSCKRQDHLRISHYLGVVNSLAYVALIQLNAFRAPIWLSLSTCSFALISGGVKNFYDVFLFNSQCS